MIPYSRLPLVTFCVIFAITVWRIVLLILNAPNLFSDEAQYWLWSQTLQLGYYSKPPMVAWVISLTTFLFGDGVAAIKIGSCLAHTGTAVTLYFLGTALYGRKTGAWAAASWILMPAVSFSSMIISTDPFLLLFWALALLALVKAWTTGMTINRWWVILGIALGLGLLSKYAMVFFLASWALWLSWTPEAKIMLRKPGAWTALAVMGLVAAPNVIWNAMNGFVTFVHTKENANLAGNLLHPLKLLEFIGGQFGVFGPLMMVALLLALYKAMKQAPPPSTTPFFSPRSSGRFLASFILPALIVMTVEAFLSRANANWTAPIFVAGTVLASRWLRIHAPILLRVSLGLHVLVTVVLYNMDWLPFAFPHNNAASFDLMKRVRGWDQVGAEVSKILADHPGARLLGDDREMLATMTYYVQPHPFDAIKWNPKQQVRDHFEQTTRLEPGEDTLIYVTKESLPPSDMVRAFRSVERLEYIRIPIHIGYAREATVWRLIGFKGYGKP